MKKLSLLALLATPAFAHVSLDNPSTATGSYYKAVLKVPHGCGSSATTGISVDLPPGLQLAHPMPKVGWKLDIVRQPVPPFDHHGTQVKEDVIRISWSGGNLPDEQYDEFVFQTRVSAQPGKVFLKVRQQCVKGATDWAQIPAEGQDAHTLKSPAAVLTITPADNAHHH